MYKTYIINKIKNSIRTHGIGISILKMVGIAIRKSGLDKKYYRIKNKNAVSYLPPNNIELVNIENELRQNNVEIIDYYIDINKYDEFKNVVHFPIDYHGGISGSVYEEKILEHYIAYDLLDMQSYKKDDKYLDVAAGNSPWAMLLRENVSLEAYAIDLKVSSKYNELSYYLEGDATNTTFVDNSIKGASLQCAYEMFSGDDDINLIKELSRILTKNGRIVISPFYMHTHYCSYSSPEYWGKGYSDKHSAEYIRWDCWGVPSSRKYDVDVFIHRILNKIRSLKLTAKLYALRNKSEIGNNIYCHFILVIDKQ